MQFLARPRSLTIQLLALVVFPMIIILMIVAYKSVSLHEQTMHALVEQRDERAINAGAKALADRFSQRQILLQILVDRLADSVPLEHMLDERPHLRQIFDGGLIVVNTKAEILFAWQPIVSWTARLHSSPVPWIIDHSLSTPMIITHVESTDGKFTLFGGITLTNLDIASAIGVMGNNPKARLYLVADDGHVIEDSAGTSIGATWPLSDVSKDNSSHLTGHEGDMVAVSSRIDTLGWMLIVEEPWEDVSNTALEMSLVAPLIVIPLIFLGMGVLAFGMMNIVLPLRRLGQSALRLAWGDYVAIQQPVGGGQEIRDLQTTLNQMAQRLSQAQNGMHSYIGAMLQGQEDERKRLARELHDDTLQALIALDQQRQMAFRALDRDPAKAAVHLQQVQQMLTEIIVRMRHTIRDMRPSYIEDLGLLPAIEMLSVQNAESNQIEICFTTTGTQQRLTADQELSLYRIAQEALTNAVRYAHATYIEVNLSFETGVTLFVKDNGQGFVLPDRPGTFAQAGHYGLMGMVERADQIGARFQIDSNVGKGTTIKVYVDK